MGETGVCNTADIPPKDPSLIELEEQLRFYKDEVERRDKLIRELAKVTASNQELSEKYGGNSHYTVDKLEEMRGRVEKLQQTLAKNKANIVEKDETISDLRNENEAMRLENRACLNRLEELQGILHENDARLSNFNTVQQKNEMILTSLQNDVRRKNAKVLELNGKLKDCEAKAKKMVDSLQNTVNGLQNSLTDMACVLRCEVTPETCLLKITDLVRSLCACEAKIAQKEDALKASEFEQRASRETIMRLSGELNHEKREREAARESAKTAEEELQKMRSAFEETSQRARRLEERVDELTLTLQSARQEAEERERKFAIADEAEARVRVKSKRIGNHAFDANSSSIGTIDLEDLEAIAEFRTKVENCFNIPQEENTAGVLSVVWCRIQELLNNSGNISSKISLLEERLLKAQDEHARTAENEEFLRDKIEQFECRRSEDGVLIDQLRGERDQLHEQLCKVALAIETEEPLSELDPDIFIETVLARIKQLKNGETEKQTRQRIHISRLQRELRDVKLRAEALELQVPIMRRRLMEAQEHQRQPHIPASQTPMTLAASEKERMRLAKQLKQTKEDSDRLREEIVLLKARLLESSQVKLADVTHQRALRSMQARTDELNRECEEYQQTARAAKSDLEHYRREYSSEMNKLRQQLNQIGEELRSTRQALEASRNSEEELLAFRTLVARQLGLRCENLTVPDYEIIDQLGRLISENQTQTAKLVTTEKAMNLVDERY